MPFFYVKVPFMRTRPKSKMEAKRDVVIIIVTLSLFCGSSVCDADGFDSARCGSDVRKALLVATCRMRLAIFEERHKDLALKDLGTSEISDRLSVIPGKSVEKNTFFSKIEISCGTCWKF